MFASGRELEKGSTLGDFQILDRLGRGAMGTVYRARDRKGSLIALKVISGQDVTDELVVRFRREAEAAMAVSHPGVARCLGLGESEGRLYIALEFISGGTLAERVHRAGRIPWREAVRLAIEIASALEAVHAAGLVHRDLKPQNVLLDEAGRAKLTDFGIARAVAEKNALTRTGEVLGTAEYMAPEQGGEAKSVDGRADLYAVGTTLYMLVAGAPPFTGPLLSVMTKKVTAMPELLRTVDPTIPAGLDALVRALLAPDPDQRPPTARAVVEAFERILAEDGKRSAGSSRARRAIAVAALGALAAGAALVGWPRLSTRDSAPSAPLPSPSPSPSPAPERSPEPPPIPEWFRKLQGPTRPKLPLPSALAVGPRPGEYLLVKDPTVVFVFVPADKFTMGTAAFEDTPEHEVALSSYFLGQHEVTNAQFERFASERKLERTPQESKARRWKDRLPGAGDDHPVVAVFPREADAYAEWAGVELPTEAQWEHAAGWDPKDGRVRHFAWGDEEPGAGHMANLRDQSFFEKCRELGEHPFETDPIVVGYKDGFPFTSPVGYFKTDVSPVGAFDMTGNAMEICRDYYDAKYYEHSPGTDPVNRTSPAPDGSGDVPRSGRGLTFEHGDAFQGCASRFRISQVKTERFIGFRVALTWKD
jgi:serine/threonine protein kinase